MKLSNLLGSSMFGTRVTEELNKVNAIIGDIFLAVMIMGCLAILLYTVYIAFKLAKAEDDGKRKEAKNHLIWAVIGLLSAVLLVTLLNTVLADPSAKATANRQITDGNINALITDVKSIIGIIFKLGGIIAALFAGYIAFKLITANDDAKRKQAKQQLIWTLVAVVAIYALQGAISFVMGNLSGYSVRPMFELPFFA